MKKAMLINDTTWEKHIGCESVTESIIQQCKKRNIDVVYRHCRGDVIHETKAIKENMNNVDIILVNGEGSLHHSPQWFSDLLKILPNNKTCFLINTIWDKMFVDIPLLDKFKLISVRESRSYYELLKVYNKPEKISIVPDLIFGLNIQNKDIKQTIKTGFGDSVLYSLREHLSTLPNYFPLHYEDNPIDAQNYVDWLKSLNFYVTGRFHGICLSIIAETKFFAFPSNSHKIEGILADLRCEELLIHSDIYSEKIYLDKDYIAIFKKYKQMAKDNINILFNEIKRLS